MSIERTSVDSSNITSAGYDPQQRTMHVEFNSGKVYEYRDVPVEDWQAFEATFTDPDRSSGSYFARTFRKWPDQGPVED